MKYTIYRELTKLAKFYPFTPDQLGFVAVDWGAAIPSDISSFTWDESKDEMFDMEGTLSKRSRRFIVTFLMGSCTIGIRCGGPKMRVYQKRASQR
jgi:hypothetical protein